eukprot:Filipodium_phascolosomae@DN6833_c0_g1_i1.p1
MNETNIMGGVPSNADVPARLREDSLLSGDVKEHGPMTQALTWLHDDYHAIPGVLFPRMLKPIRIDTQYLVKRLLWRLGFMPDIEGFPLVLNDDRALVRQYEAAQFVANVRPSKIEWNFTMNATGTGRLQRLPAGE